MTSAYTLEALYSMYSPFHIAVIISCAAIVGLSSILFVRIKISPKVMLIIGTALTASCSMSLLIYSVITRTYDLEWYLPFHICTSMMLVYPLALIFKNKVREVLKDFIVLGGFFGCFLEIIFPINTLPFLSATHFATIMIWIYHVVIGTVSMYFIASKNYRKFNCTSVIIVISLLLPCAYVMNSAFNTNFLFLNESLKRFPLTIFYGAFGNNGILLFAILLLMFAAYLQILFNTVYKLILSVRKKAGLGRLLN